MKIIFNSDILYPYGYVRNLLPKRQQQIFKVCASKKHEIILPLTTLLEFNCKHNDLVDSERAKLEEAYQILDKNKISYTKMPANEVVASPDLIELIKSCGVKDVKVVEPTLEDFKDAHKRACLHEPPTPPNTKSDEMRDLVIWVIALRLAKEHGGAMLISNDEVHTHSRGDNEAHNFNLLRISTIEDACNYFEVETPAWTTVQKIVFKVFYELKEELPIIDANIRGLDKPKFRYSPHGLEYANAIIKLKASNNGTLKMNFVANLGKNRIDGVHLVDIFLDEKPFEKQDIYIKTDKPFEMTPYAFEERMKSLKEILGGV